MSPGPHGSWLVSGDSPDHNNTAHFVPSGKPTNVGLCGTHVGRAQKKNSMPRCGRCTQVRAALARVIKPKAGGWHDLVRSQAPTPATKHVIDCPACDAQIATKKEPGQPIRCTQCRKIITVPAIDSTSTTRRQIECSACHAKITTKKEPGAGMVCTVCRAMIAAP